MKKISCLFRKKGILKKKEKKKKGGGVTEIKIQHDN